MASRPSIAASSPAVAETQRAGPRARCTYKTDVRNTLRAPVKVTINGRRRKVSTQLAILLRLRKGRPWRPACNRSDAPVCTRLTTGRVGGRAAALTAEDLTRLPSTRLGYERGGSGPPSREGRKEQVTPS